MKVAIEGCAHGDLDKIYAALKRLEETEQIRVDLLIICGDFQAIRNGADLDCMAVPPKYKEIGTFHKYYSGEVEAPFPTLFIGGNHEASNYLWELYYGGWVAPKIFYLGHSGIVKFGGLRIAGLSGIYDARHYNCGYFERLPYNPSTMRSAYHVRQFEVKKLLQVKEPIDIFLSHDWPRGVANSGHCDKARLLRQKPYFASEISQDVFGSPAAAQLCNRLRPKYWFSAHHHVKFPAIIHHERSTSELTLTTCTGEWTAGEAQDSTDQHTKFLALDKCLPGRDFLQVVDFPESEEPKVFQYDVEWLCILKRNHQMPLGRRKFECDTCPASCGGVSAEETSWVASRFAGASGLTIPENFCQTAPVYPQRVDRIHHYRNPQTLSLMEALELSYTLDLNQSQHAHQHTSQHASVMLGNPEEIDIDADEGAAEESTIANPEEIDI